MTPQPIDQCLDALRPWRGAEVSPTVGTFRNLGAQGPDVPGRQQRPEVRSAGRE